MNNHKDNIIAQEGDLVELVSLSKKIYFVRLNPGDKVQTHRGILLHDNLIGLPWGSKVFSHIGSPYFLLQPSLHDLLVELRRTTQIIYPKEIGFILVNMNIGPGANVIEAGSGSGALTTALAWAVGRQGRVSSYEIRSDVLNLARKNIERLDLTPRVKFTLRDIKDGFDEVYADSLFLDVPNPYDYISQVKKAIKPGGHFGAILPTTNQVSDLIIALQRQDFAFIDVCEILLRYYKPVHERLRPTDRMVAHTGYLVFARSIITLDETNAKQSGRPAFASDLPEESMDANNDV